MTLDSKSTEVARTTLAFDETEDRVRLTCALDDEQVVILWFTWRLASRLVTHLLSLITPLSELEDGGPRQRPAEGEGANIDKVADEEKAAQANSESKQLVAAEAPVIATASTPSWVVTSIDITNGPMFVRLSFREGAGQMPACLSLEHAQLARWLEGLRHCYIQAGWSMNAWLAPRDTQFGIPSAKNVVLH
jgi:hypothetical protein